jgi:Fcf1
VIGVLQPHTRIHVCIGCLVLLGECLCVWQIDLVKGMMDCLYAECKPCITDCVMAELEKLGQKYRVALKVAKVGPVSAPPFPGCGSCGGYTFAGAVAGYVSG